MSVKIYAVIFGIFLLAVGILGFLPGITPNGYLFNIFTVNPIHNILHIIAGLIALIVSYNAHASRSFFRIFGVIYLFLAVLAFLVGSNFIIMRLNDADNLFHLIIGAVFIYLGFGKPRHRNERALVEKETIRRREGIDTHKINSNETEKRLNPDDDHINKI